jgi:hypothetical protein
MASSLILALNCYDLPDLSSPVAQIVGNNKEEYSNHRRDEIRVFADEQLQAGSEVFVW